MDFERFKQINEQRPHFGEMTEPSIVSSYQNSGCGDEYRIFLKIDDETGIVREASFVTTGCSFSTVALSLSAEWILGKTIHEAQRIEAADIESLFTFPERRKSYPATAAEAFGRAVREYQSNSNS